jgi:hypothetical protein
LSASYCRLVVWPLASDVRQFVAGGVEGLMLAPLSGEFEAAGVAQAIDGVARGESFAGR